MDARIRNPNLRPILTEVFPDGEKWNFVGFQKRRLVRDQEEGGFESEFETCLVLLSGVASIVVDGQILGKIGQRMSPFEGLPFSVYVPPGLQWTLKAKTEIEFAICTAPGSGDAYSVRIFRPEDLATETRGEGTNTRYVTNILAEGDNAAHSLFVIEVRTPGGHTSSYPPHKHDTDALPEESLLEEIYYSRFDPPQGFGFQRIYNDDRSLDRTLLLEDGTISVVSKGYHPCSVCHGYEMYQLCVMAGPHRVWKYRVDPDHAWLSGD